MLEALVTHLRDRVHVKTLSRETLSIEFEFCLYSNEYQHYAYVRSIRKRHNRRHRRTWSRTITFWCQNLFAKTATVRDFDIFAFLRAITFFLSFLPLFVASSAFYIFSPPYTPYTSTVYINKVFNGYCRPLNPFIITCKRRTTCN